MLTPRAKAALALIAALALTTCGKAPEEQAADAINAMVRELPAPAKAELQPTLAPMLRELAADNPALAARIAGFEAEEKRLLAQLARQVMERAALEVAPAAAPQASFRPQTMGRPGGGAFDWLVPPANAQILDAISPGLAGGISSMALTRLGGAISEQLKNSPDPSKELAKLIGKDGEKVTMRADVGKDGTVTSTIESNLEVAVLGINANSRTSVSTKTLCPDADGRVELTVRLRTDGSTGRATTKGERYEAQVSIVADETAEIISLQMKLKYDVAKSGADGGVRVGGNLTLVSAGGRGPFAVADVDADGSGDTLMPSTIDAMKKVAGLGVGAASAAESHWQGGNCIGIEATSPGKVKPATVSQIDVKTMHKHEKKEVRAGIKVTLEGGASVDPAGFGSPGKFAHTAVGEENKTMKLLLRATSRRGAAEETLIVTTRARGYAINGGGGQFRGSGTVCDLTQPFTVYGNANIEVTFTPQDANGGSYSYTGAIAGARLSGKGTYQVHYVKGEPFKITASGPGSATAMGRTFTQTGSEAYVLTPKEC